MAVQEHGQQLGVSCLCRALGVSRATVYRRRREPAVATARQPSPRALDEMEREQVRRELFSERFTDRSPYEVYAALLDENQYLCSVRTMYRVLAQAGACRERRDQLVRPVYRKPELLARGPNQVWSWDITKLKGPEKWTYYYLYVILDIFSRYVVGWMLADREHADLARKLIEQTLHKQDIPPHHLIIHSDRGPSMTSHNVAHLLDRLGVTKSLSRPNTSNDNPYSESQFKTMKYQPEFPERFGGYDDALTYSRQFLGWYNNEHYHSGIGLLTPASVHYGQAEQILAARTETLANAYIRNPNRFVNGKPKPAKPPEEVWINPPKPAPENEKRLPEIQCPESLSAVPLKHPRSSYPSVGCVPAEPTSVSLNERSLIHQTPLNTRAMPPKIPGVRGLAPDEARQVL